MYAKGCPVEGVKYTVKVLSLRDRQLVAKTAVDKQISYGVVPLPDLQAGNYEIQVTMEGDLDSATGFKVSLYTLKSKLEFKDEYWVLSLGLRAAMERKDPKLYQSKAEDG